MQTLTFTIAKLTDTAMALMIFKVHKKIDLGIWPGQTFNLHIFLKNMFVLRTVA